MKRYVRAAIATFALVVLMSSASKAVVCGGGPYRAGCAGPNGAVVVRRPAGAYYPPPAYYRPPFYVAPPPVYVAPPPYYYRPPVYYGP
jgi:hypothetical protein